MKRLLALAALLVAATACTTTTNTNTGAGNTNARSNADAAASPSPAGPTQADIEARERESWEQIKSKNWDAFAATLADDFVFVGGQGLGGKAETVESIRKVEMTEYTLSDFRFVRVDADLAVVTYTATDRSTFEGRANRAQPVRNSTAWANRGGRWLIVYHQESDVPEAAGATSTPAPAASPAAPPAASPAATPAAVASATDAEKAVWEAIRAGNAEGFGNYLLPDALEVEPEGVFDKAGSVGMVMTLDASKVTLSDFKETKLDADATLVTYKAAIPERGRTIEMYHSTIWTNRGGRWRAAFHHGTYAQSPGPR